MWVKICGITNYEDARAAVDLGADALGFVFAPSTRRVSSDLVGAIVRQLPREPMKFGVFVNTPVSIVAETVHAAGLTGVQLHGHEDETYIARLQDETQGKRVQILKALAYGPDLVESSRRFGSIAGVHAVLVDSRSGGSGETFDWPRGREVFRRAAGHARLILAGGLTAENVEEAATTLQPWGVDVSSGIEAEPGKKDHDKVRRFIEAARRRQVTLEQSGSVGS